MSDDPGGSAPPAEAEPDTIFALSSGAGVAGVAVVRISGPQAVRVLDELLAGARPAPREARLTVLHAPGRVEPLDQAMVLWFAQPRSFTGEDVVELHLHGGRAVVAAVLGVLAALPGFRLAAPGEFTRRAFDAGKLDLASVEGLADLINAETEAQRRQALRQMRGALGARCEAIRTSLVSALAHLEAEIDFAEDEDDIPDGVLPKARELATATAGELGRLLADSGRGERLREGLQVAIVGAPNVGKSSLLNAMAQRDMAIVSETAGTTRDVIEVHLDLGGLPVTLADTAGLRDLAVGEDATAASIELEGMRRARLQAEDADLRLAVFDATRWPEVESDVAALVDEDSLVVVNKGDLLVGAGPVANHALAPVPAALRSFGGEPLVVSARTGEGLGGLLEALSKAVEGRLGGGDALITRARHREALTACREALLRAQTVRDTELLAEDLRLAVRALGQVTGRVDVEDILDLVFRDFCIGK